MQLILGDAEGLGKHRQTRREIFLAEMEQVVPERRCWLTSSRITRARAVWTSRRIRWIRCCASSCCSDGMR